MHDRAVRHVLYPSRCRNGHTGRSMKMRVRREEQNIIDRHSRGVKQVSRFGYFGLFLLFVTLFMLCHMYLYVHILMTVTAMLC